MNRFLVISSTDLTGCITPAGERPIGCSEPYRLFTPKRMTAPGRRLTHTRKNGEEVIGIKRPANRRPHYAVAPRLLTYEYFGRAEREAASTELPFTKDTHQEKSPITLAAAHILRGRCGT